MTRGARCGNSARRDLWEPGEGDFPGPPDSALRMQRGRGGMAGRGQRGVSAWPEWGLSDGPRGAWRGAARLGGGGEARAATGFAGVLVSCVSSERAADAGVRRLGVLASSGWEVLLGVAVSEAPNAGLVVGWAASWGRLGNLGG